MAQLKITLDTWLKTEVAQAKTLPPNRKHLVKAGELYDLDSWSDADAGHLQVMLERPINGQKHWFVFDDHVDLIGAERSVFNLAVPFYSQRDNAFQPERTCNSSSNAMLLKFLKPTAITGDDDYINRYVRGKGDSTDWDVHTRALAENGIQSRKCTNGTYAHLEASLRANIPVVIGVLHRGEVSSPTGGHIIVVTGWYPDGFIVNDPWGAPFGYVSGSSGDSCRVPRQPSLDRRWMPGEGWFRLVTAIDGKPTGLKV